jgi:hypothetical protein
MPQKFFQGDHVFIGDVPPYMRHFQNNCEAIVLYTYAEQFGASGSNPHKQYGVYILPDGGESAWYEEDQFKFLASDKFDLLPKNHIARVNWENKQARAK